MRLLRSTTRNPYENLAIEEELLRYGQIAVLLWVNDPCVVIGRNQNPYWEADLTFMAERRIALARRLSGGGAVFHDGGNLNYSLVSDKPCAEQARTLALQALAQTGVHADASGRNDLVADNAKIGGMAERIDEHHARHVCHGTLMVCVNLELMERALRPSPLKLGKHGIDSVKARVTNLEHVVPSISVEGLMHAFENAIGQTARPIGPASTFVQERARQLQTSEWLFGASPPYECTMEAVFDGDLYQFSLNIRNGAIESLSIHTDARNPPNLTAVNRELIGRPFSPESFRTDAHNTIARLREPRR